MTTTLRALLDACYARMSMQGGTDTQVYTEDRLILAVNQRFTMLFDDYWWNEYTTVQAEYTTSSATGSTTADLSTVIKRYSDIHSIYTRNSDHPLPEAPRNVRIDAITDPCVQPVPEAARVFRILPLSSNPQTIWITYRTRPARFAADSDVIKLDFDLMILGTIWDIMEDDATNPGAADKFRMMYQERLKQLERLQFNMPRSVTPRLTYPTRWT